MTLYSVDEVLVMAARIERNGGRFYQAAAARCADARVAGALQQLAEWEGSHADVCQGLRDRWTRALDPVDRTFDPGGEAEQYLQAAADQHIFSTDDPPEALLRDLDSPRAVLQLALRFERDSILFFERLAQLVPPGGRVEVERLVQEERGHVVHLQRLLEQSSS